MNHFLIFWNILEDIMVAIGIDDQRIFQEIINKVMKGCFISILHLYWCIMKNCWCWYKMRCRLFSKFTMMFVHMMIFSSIAYLHMENVKLSSSKKCTIAQLHLKYL